MPVFTPGQQRELGVINAETTDPQGERTSFFFNADKGVPRRDDLGTVRMLEKTHPISLPLGTVKTQVSTTDWTVSPTIENPSDAHIEAAEEIEEFLDGNYNSNGAPFDHLAKQWAHDIISIDAGVIEKVPDNRGFLSELYPRDGAVFTKSIDRHDRLPEPPDAAYWQFQFSGATEPFDPTRSLHEMAEEYGGGASPYMQNRGDPIGFSREQLVWTETNPASWRHYGLGKVQQASRIAEIILNQDTTNLSYFSKNEIPDGVVNVVEANQDEIENFRNYWQEEVRGQEHVMPIVGGAGSEIDWIPFRPTPDELEFMTSQKWYHQLVWMVFGLNQGEVGDIENINRATMKEQAANVFRTTTKPLLDRMENDINRHILSFMEAYHRVAGEVEFSWQIDNPAMRARERERQREDLESGTKTVNEIRRERGEEELDWGDMPLELMRSVARNHPDWALENWADVENPPMPSMGGLLSAYGGSEGKANREESSFDSLPTDSSRSFSEEFNNISGKDGDSLRDEPYEFQYPPLVGHAEDTEGEVGSAIGQYEEELLSIAEEHFPEEEPPTEFGHRPAFDSELEEFASSLSGDLAAIVTQRNIEAMEIAADYHASELEEEAEKAFARKAGEEVAVDIEFDVEDTPAADRMRREAAARMVSVSDTVKETVRTTLLNVAEDGGNVTAATAELRDVLGTNIPNHARLVARTETRMSQSAGSQALAESSSLIAGKEWNASEDGRTRVWHDAMDGEIVPKEESFLVPDVGDEEQPSDYPRSAQTVGDDQPFNCRCVQEPVLAEDMPDDLKALNSIASVRAYPLPKDSDRMREVIKSNASGSGDSLADVLSDALDAGGSRTAACKQLGISTATLYQWGKEIKMPEFVR